MLEELTHLTDQTNTCWHWKGRLDRDGYPRYKGKLAYRLMYQAVVGPVPEGLTLDHLCRVRHCVNPAHLEPVTHAENVRRSPPGKRGHNRANVLRAQAPTCKNGHPYDESNTYARPPSKKGGKRNCRTCNREAARRYARRKAEA